MSFEERVLVLGAAFFLDLALGDPEYRLHPVRLIGGTVSLAERLLWRPRGRLWGVAAALGVVFLWVAVALFLSGFLPAELFFLYSFLAQGELLRRVWRVCWLAASGRVQEARNSLSLLVTRDTEVLDGQELVRCSVETLAENTSDGFFGPAFYYLLGGLPLLFAYKVVETADSMVGYKSERYRDFGWAFARLDDALNFVPSRLCALFVCFSSLLLGWGFAGPLGRLRFARLHESPNAGYPESAFSGALGVRLGGFYSYFGKLVFKVPLGEDKAPPTFDVCARALILSLSSCAAFVAVSFLLALALRTP